MVPFYDSLMVYIFPYMAYSGTISITSIISDNQSIITDIDESVGGSSTNVPVSMKNVGPLSQSLICGI